MPTILINTNLKKKINKSEHETISSSESTKPTDNDDDSIQNLDDDFRKDLNVIVAKLLHKSNLMDSFTIKYEIDDLFANKNDNLDSTEKSQKNSCICIRMARLFNDLLSNKENSTISNSSNSPTTDTANSQQELKNIYKELKLVRKSQNDMLDKFNLIFTKLSPPICSSKNQNSNNRKSYFLGQNGDDRQVYANNGEKRPTLLLNNNNKIRTTNADDYRERENLLTGAKKRKFNAKVTSKINDMPAKISKNDLAARSNSSTPSSTHSSSPSSSASSVTSYSTSNTIRSKLSILLDPEFNDVKSKDHEDYVEPLNESENELDQFSSEKHNQNEEKMPENVHLLNDHSSGGGGADEVDEEDFDESTERMEEFNENQEMKSKRHVQKSGAAQCSNLVDLSEVDDVNLKALNRSNSVHKYKSRSNDQFEDETMIDNVEEFNELSNDYYPEDNDNYDSLPNDELNPDSVQEDETIHKNQESSITKNEIPTNVNLVKNINNIKYMKPLPNQTSPNFSQNHLKQYIDHHNRIKLRQHQHQHQQQQVSYNRNLILQHQLNLSSKHSPSGVTSGAGAGISLNNHNNNNLNQFQPNFSNRFSNISTPSSTGNQQQQRSSFINENYSQNEVKSNRSLDVYNQKSHIKPDAVQSFSSSNQFSHLPSYSNNTLDSYAAIGGGNSKSTQQFTASNEIKQDIDIEDLFKGDGPKYLQLDSYKDFKPPITVLSDNKYYIDEHHASIAYSKSKSRRNFAAHLTKLVFTPRERLESNCNGRFGKKALDSVRLCAIRNTLFKYYPCKQSTLILNGDKITSGDHDESNVWVRDCIPAIDESNRVLKKQLISWYKKNHNNFQNKVDVSKQNETNTNNLMNNNQSSVNGMVSNTACSTNAEFGQKYNFDNLDIEQEFEDDFEEDHE